MSASRGLFIGLSTSIALALLAAAPVCAQTLKMVKERGSLNCGVNQGLAGFSLADDKGQWAGLDVDLCRAIAAAVFNDPSKVSFTPLSTADRFSALQQNKVDVLIRNSTWTMSRETEFKINFVGVNYYDGQGFLVHKSPEIGSALELDGAKVCVQSDTTTADNLGDFFKSNNLKYELVPASSTAQALKDYADGKCTVLTSDVSQLYAQRLQLPIPAIIRSSPISSRKSRLVRRCATTIRNGRTSSNGCSLRCSTRKNSA